MSELPNLSQYIKIEQKRDQNRPCNMRFVVVSRTSTRSKCCRYVTGTMCRYQGQTERVVRGARLKGEGEYEGKIAILVKS